MYRYTGLTEPFGSVTRVFTENKKKIGTLTITTCNDEENNEATSVESAPNTSSDDPEHAGTQQLSFLTQIRNSTQKPPQVRAGVQSDHGHLPTRQRPTGRILRNIHRVPQPGSVRERHQHMEGAKTADHCEGALEDLRFVLIDHHKLRQEIWTRPARDMLRPFQTFKQFIAQPKVRNIDLKAAKKKEFLDKIANPSVSQSVHKSFHTRSEDRRPIHAVHVATSEDSKTRLAKLHYLIPSFIPPKSLSSVPPFHTLHFTPLTVDLTDARNIVFQIRFFAEEAELPVVNEDTAFLVEDRSTSDHRKPCFPRRYIAESSSQPAQSALHNLAFSFGSPTSAGGRKASVVSPNPHSGSTIGASGQTGSSAMPHFHLPAN
ncbi:hypothetical protein BLNAU_15360 [Blattamonas nauphoetae]|uniref:Uncharacterized protein n=1 Tax=Blattamonas nauphoetae TaxID=2049346 RepID=A0ABQ9XFQ9_9EUKA|nr:hypothetical protein BLNAU_15360 [Blattamonas nauphoetae]